MLNAKDLKELASSLSILYVEDEKILRENLENTLGKLFENVHVAKNGQEAFEVFKKEHIDIVLTDINMPIMDGVELIRLIHEYSKEEVFISVLSAHDESKLLIKLINLGINSFINKPVEKDLLIRSLYRSCKIITDKKLLIHYEAQLQVEASKLQRKNNVIEKKITEIAQQRNMETSSHIRKPVKGIFKKKVDDTLQETTYFTTLVQDDRDELRDLSLELENYVTMLFQADTFNENYLQRLSEVLEKYASIINTYPEFFDIAVPLYNLGHSILNLKDKFMNNLTQTGTYLESLQLSLDSYRINIWNNEAKNPKFYNASLNIDINLIINYLEGNETQENDIDFF